MRFQTNIPRAGGARLMGACLAVFSLSQAWAIEKMPSEPLELLLTLGRGAVIDCPKGVVRVSTSNPETVDVV
ncbi:MAG TPA: hypothetical protein VMH81_34735, partial [Bryobacteraceae bacterium]|nr:hypothetical protein [Bryobacteraceae bacterium]